MHLGKLLLAGVAMVAATIFTLPAQAEVSTTTLNVRSGPGIGYRVVDVLRPGQQVDVTRQSGGWCYVVKPGPDGWASCRYLAQGGSVPVDARAAIANASVNVRSGPGLNFRVVDGLRRGERVTIVGQSGNWCDIEKAGPDGWVACRFLSEGGGAITIRPTPGLTFSFSFGRGDGFSIRPPRDRSGSSNDPVCLVTFFQASQVEGGADANVQRARVLPRFQAEAIAAQDSRSAVFEYGTPQQTRETCAYLDSLN